jgi:hypothetical protein
MKNQKKNQKKNQCEENLENKKQVKLSFGQTLGIILVGIFIVGGLYLSNNSPLQTTDINQTQYDIKNPYIPDSTSIGGFNFNY